MSFFNDNALTRRSRTPARTAEMLAQHFHQVMLKRPAGSAARTDSYCTEDDHVLQDIIRDVVSTSSHFAAQRPPLVTIEVCGKGFFIPIPIHSREAIPVSIPVPGSMDFHSHSRPIPKLNSRSLPRKFPYIIIFNLQFAGFFFYTLIAHELCLVIMFYIL